MQVTRERLLDAILVLEQSALLVRPQHRGSDPVMHEKITDVVEWIMWRSEITRKEIDQRDYDLRLKDFSEGSKSLRKKHAEPPVANEAKLASIYNMEIIEMLADKYDVNEVVFIDQPMHTVDGRTYFVESFQNIETIFEEAEGGEVYLLSYNVNRGFAVKPEEGCSL